MYWHFSNCIAFQWRTYGLKEISSLLWEPVSVNNALIFKIITQWYIFHVPSKSQSCICFPPKCQLSQMNQFPADHWMLRCIIIQHFKVSLQLEKPAIFLLLIVTLQCLSRLSSLSAGCVKRRFGVNLLPVLSMGFSYYYKALRESIRWWACIFSCSLYLT